MPTEQKRDRPGDKEAQDGERLRTAIGNQVLRSLVGTGGEGRVQVRSLWGAYYRVNILRGENPGSITIAASYFLETDENGNIIESTPPLTQRKQKHGL